MELLFIVLILFAIIGFAAFTAYCYKEDTLRAVIALIIILILIIALGLIHSSKRNEYYVGNPNNINIDKPLKP